MDLFKPNLSIKISPSLKTYDVEATVVVPNGCYMKIGGSSGAPPDQFTLPEAEPITLAIRKTDGPCTEALKVIKFKVRWLPLTIGKSSVIAFVTVDDEVVSAASRHILTVDDSFLTTSFETPLQPAGSGIEVNSVAAWINAQPPGPPTLISIVNLSAPCSNYEFSFEDLGPFGFTGKTNLLRLEARLLNGLCDRVIFEGPIRFSKEVTSPAEFDSVAVEFEGELYFDPLEIAV